MNKISGSVEFKFDKGINIKMVQILDQKDATGIVLFGTVKFEGKDTPVIVLHEGLTNREEFVAEFYKLIQRHGVKLNY